MKVIKDKFVHIRITEEQHELLVKAAQLEERTLCDWVRRIATKEANNLISK